MEKIKLFCFPHAGSSAVYFTSWEEKLGEYIELLPAELAGRGMRCDEPLYKSMNEVINDMIEYIGSDLSEPFAFYGHSSGAIMAYALACKMKGKLNKQPVHIFLSSICPPHYLGDEDIKLSHLSKERLKERLLDMGGVSEELFEDEYLTNFFLKVMLADMKILEEYKYKDYSNDIDSDLSVMYGKFDDRVKHSEEWQEYTNGECKTCEYDGYHFFHIDDEEKVIDYINSTLKKYCK